LGKKENVSVTFSADVAQGSPASTDIIAVYKTAAGPVYFATLFAGVSLPQEFTIAASDIVAAFPHLNSLSDILLADVIDISTSFTTQNGTVLTLLNEDGSTNYGTNIANSVLYTTKISYPISCPSDIGGEYVAVSNGDNTDGQPPAVDFTQDVTLTDLGGGAYEMSDFSGGVYFYWYGIYGVGPFNPGTFTDVCGTITGTFSDPWGNQLVIEDGSVNPDGTISVSWVNVWGDFLTTVLTPK
jgi:hypothetical protein